MIMLPKASTKSCLDREEKPLRPTAKEKDLTIWN
jgi:hypothetical protein